MKVIKNENGIFVELPKEKITFYGNTEEEKKANELIFDLSLEMSGLYDKTKEKDKEIERLNNIIDELHNLFCQLDSEIMKKNYTKANKINFTIRNKLKELKEGK